MLDENTSRGQKDERHKRRRIIAALVVMINVAPAVVSALRIAGGDNAARDQRVTSVNQSGGITAHTLNVNVAAPPTCGQGEVSYYLE